MKIHPKGRHLLVRYIPEVYSTRLVVVHDVIVPEKKNAAAEDRIVKGEVVAVGARVRADVKAGDTVYFSQLVKKEAGRALGLDPNLFLIMDQGLAFIYDQEAA